jgi:hypothetical protein
MPYYTGNSSADKQIDYLKRRFKDNQYTQKQIKYLIETFGSQTQSGKAERSRTSARSNKNK